jgi:ATP-dependent RNA helicase DDX55/SPB4
LSFLIPIVERLLRLDDPIKKHHVGAIIVSPTRELATQIHTVLLSLLQFHGPSAAALKPPDENCEDAELLPHYPSSTPKVVPQLLLGGTTTPAQDLSHFLKNSPNLLVSTPGRLLELLQSPHVHCPQSSFEVLVLDEADRLLDMGFKDDLQRILGRLPKQRRTGLFSASVTDAVGEIVRVGLRNPVKVIVKVKAGINGEERRTPASLQMSYLLTPPSQKWASLANLLVTVKPTPQKTIVYLSTCAAVDYFSNILPSILSSKDNHDFTLIPLHGKHPDKVRQKNFAKFVNSVGSTILLTTDLAARGLDVPQVDLVVQIDPPSDPKVFLHRCGRAGRAGRRGLAVLFLQPGREEDYIAFLEIRKTPVTPLSLPVSVSQSEADEVATKMRLEVLKDRALHDKGQRAFVSWVKSYSKHQASSIFRTADLDWADLGNAWALVKLPKMPELKTWEGDKTLGIELDLDTYVYKDKAREAARLVALEEYRNSEPGKYAASKGPKKPRGAWSDKTDAHDRREDRRDKKMKRKEADRQANMTPEERVKDEELQELLKEVKRRRKEKEDDEFEGFEE